jgi:DNA mismatch endonuclease, patch repair protein
MPDIVDKKTRSRMMSGIRGKNTKPELLIRSQLHRAGFRFRLHVRDLPGKPDIVLPKYKAAIFVQGCFWHGHDCHLFKVPGTRTEWWLAKIERNRQNDAVAIEALLDAGWRVAEVWECALKGRGRLDSSVISDVLIEWLITNKKYTLRIRGRTV